MKDKLEKKMIESDNELNLHEIDSNLQLIKEITEEGEDNVAEKEKLDALA